MKILITNDDGIQSKGIFKLKEIADKFGEGWIVAPHRERSTTGHSLTLHKPLRVEKISERVYTTSGSPADCVYLGVRAVLGSVPDVILSGINLGANLGTDIHYSGTVSGAREGALHNIKSFAFSLVDTRQLAGKNEKREFDFEMAGEVCEKILSSLLSVEFPSHSIINVNIPNLPREQIKGIKLARQGFRNYSKEITERVDPRGKKYYWLGGAYIGFDKIENCDCTAVSEQYVSVSPLTIDATHEGFLKELRPLF